MGMRKMHKKAIIFSIIAVTIAELVFLIFSGTYSSEININNNIIYNRISSVDKEINRFIDYIPEAGSFAGFSALESMYVRMNTTKKNFSDEGVSFEQVFLDCTFKGTGVQCGNNPHHLDLLLFDFAQEIEKTREITFGQTILDYGLLKEGYWYLSLWVEVEFDVQDTYSTWSFTKNITFLVSTLGVNDPEYIFINEKYGGNEERVIFPNSIQSSREWDRELFADFFTGKEYHVSTNGSCLSERFEGTRSNSDLCAIESIVDAEEHPGLLAPVNQSIGHIDYQVLEKISFPCHAPGQVVEEVNPRVGIGYLDENITLSFLDASRYGLIGRDSFNNNNLLIANGCP